MDEEEEERLILELQDQDFIEDEPETGNGSLLEEMYGDLEEFNPHNFYKLRENEVLAREVIERYKSNEKELREMVARLTNQMEECRKKALEDFREIERLKAVIFGMKCSRCECKCKCKK